MVRLDAAAARAAFALYRAQEAFFPLVGAVLLGAQHGEVYADSAVRPCQYYVEHCFGFAQIFGQPCKDFEAVLHARLLCAKDFSAPKVRLYTPLLPDFLQGPGTENLRSIRQRFVLDAPAYARSRAAWVPQLAGISVRAVTEGTLDSLAGLFELADRFWPDAAAFARKARAQVALHEGRPAAICYAAALADDKAEIDVLTLPEHRKLGLARAAVVHFVDACLEDGIEPLWDCFTNNAGSMGLCESMQFSPARPPYTFYTIAR